MSPRLYHTITKKNQIESKEWSVSEIVANFSLSFEKIKKNFMKLENIQLYYKF